MQTLKIVNVVGARPNFMKIAPLVAKMREYPGIEPYLLHTGQHYDHAMSELFFKNLRLPEPDHYLGVGSGDHGAQTGRVMIAFEETLRALQPHIVIVVGDVNSTIACGLVAVKMGIKLAHVEAGLRSFDRSMPEEVNRVLTDQISDYLFTTEAAARDNLAREGVSEDKIFFVGNVMIDTLLRHRQQASSRGLLTDLGIAPRAYALVTLHRPANVDDRRVLTGLMHALCTISERLPVVFPVHPRTRQRLTDFGLEAEMREYPDLRLLAPLGYLDFLQCMDNAQFVITDSGGIQEETTVLGVPCITTRENTERPVTVVEGTNVVVGRDSQRLLDAVHNILLGEGKVGRSPELWDGKAAERIVDILWEREGASRLAANETGS
jgi:UDP-N-acetylglucosamine 2-epimerase (non-hydrolysing)